MDNNAQSGQLEAAPALFPPPSDDNKRFATTNKFAFGWTADGYCLGKMSIVSDTIKPLKSWPLTREGWADAWEYLQKEHADLSERISAVALHSAARAAQHQRKLEQQRAIESETILAKLSNDVLLGGYGYAEALSPKSRVDVYFTKKAIWITRHNDFVPQLRIEYSEAESLELEGGAYKKGARMFGGGFGLLGAAEGIAAAAIINNLSSSTSIRTVIKLQAVSAEVFLFTDQSTPRNLEMRLAEPRALIRSRQREVIASEPASTPDLADQLLRLGDMVERGLLTQDEFATAKSRLLCN